MSIVIKTPLNLDKSPTWGSFGRHLVAEGDSWFSLGALNLVKNSNLVNELVMPAQSTMAVNCAAPGHLIQHMADRRGQDQFFTDALQGGQNFGRFWEGLLLSGGGNDLIAALDVPPTAAAQDRVLLRPDEAGAGADIARYVSAEGWLRLKTFLFASVRTIAALRDASQNPDCPIIMHTYAVPVARLAGTVGNQAGWLYTRLQAYGIPEADRQPLTEHLFQRLRELIKSFETGESGGGASEAAVPKLHVFDSAAVPGLVPATVGSTGSSGDWINEIHLTRTGCRKIGVPMGFFVEQILKQYGF